MQYKLGNIDQQQRLETISEQDRLMRERSAIDAVEAQRNATEKHRLTIDEIFTRANAELSKEPGYTYLQGKARLARQQGNKADEELYATQMAETMTPYVQALYKQTTGRDLTEKDIAATLAGGGVTGAEKGISEYGTSKRFTEELPIKKITAETSAGHLKLAREQFGAEQGAGGKTTDYYKVMHTKITNVQRYLTSMKEFIESGADTSTILIDWKKLMGGPATPQLLGQALSRLSKYDTKAMKVSLGPEEEAWLDRAWDITELQKEKESGGIGSSVLEDFSGQPTTAPVTMPITTPTTMPTAQPSAHQTGEKKMLTVNGERGIYIWDGDKWLLSNKIQ